MQIPRPRVEAVDDRTIRLSGFRVISNIMLALDLNSFHRVEARMMELWSGRHEGWYRITPTTVLQEIRRSRMQDRCHFMADDVESAMEQLNDTIDIICQVLDEAINGDLISGVAPIWVVTADGRQMVIETPPTATEFKDMISKVEINPSIAESLRMNYESRLAALTRALSDQSPPLLPQGFYPYNNYHGQWCMVYKQENGEVVAELPIKVQPRYSVEEDITYEAPKEYLFTIRAKIKVFLDWDVLDKCYYVHDVRIFRENGRDLVTPHLSSTNSCVGSMDLPKNIQTMADLAKFRDQLATLLTVVNVDSLLNDRDSLSKRWHPFLDPVGFGFTEVETAGWGPPTSDWYIQL